MLSNKEPDHTLVNLHRHADMNHVHEIMKSNATCQNLMSVFCETTSFIIIIFIPAHASCIEKYNYQVRMLHFSVNINILDKFPHQIGLFT